MSNTLSGVQRQPLTISQLRTALHMKADGVEIPETAVLSRQKFSTFLTYVDNEMLKSPKKSKLEL